MGSFKPPSLRLALVSVALSAVILAVVSAIDCCSTVYVNGGYVRACAIAYGTSPDNSYGYATAETSTYLTILCARTDKIREWRCKAGAPTVSISYNAGEVGSWLYAEAKYDSLDVWATAEATLSGSTWFCRV